MDTAQFLKTLLPDAGFKYTAQWHPMDGHAKGGVFIHKAFDDVDLMAAEIARCAERGRTIYHACSTYKEVIFKTSPKGREYIAGRTKENAHSARALWIDFDVKPGVAGAYENKLSAVEALKGFRRDLAIPVPMVVESGYGIHAYFLLEESLQRTEWEALAHVFRQCLETSKVLYDRSRTCDIASILRPPGSVNLKDPENPRSVRCIKEGERAEAAHYREKFEAFLQAHDVTPELPPVSISGFDMNSDLIAVSYPDSYATEIVKHCAQVQGFSKDGGVTEPVWYAMLGLLKHCKDGDKYVHEWGQNHPDYDYDNNQSKMDQWEFGPTTCDKLRQLYPERCAKCTQTCGSPISLGRIMPENVPHTPLVIETINEEVEVVHVGPGSEFWPNGYEIREGVLTLSEPDENGHINNHPVAAPGFWILSIIRNEEGEFMLHMRAEVKHGKQHDFDVPAASLSSIDKFKAALAANHVFAKDVGHKTGARLLDFAIQQALAIQRKRDEINTHSQMGWSEAKDRFLMGDTLITADGARQVRVAQSILNINKGEQSLAGAYASQGTIQEYHDGVMHLFGKPGYEAVQYILASALGAYLAPFVRNDEWHGIPLAVYSSKSGYGKTTAAAIGLNAVCKNFRSRSSDGTQRSFKKMLSVYGSMPVFFDELTDKINPLETKDLLYNWSLGIDRLRLKGDGTIQNRGEMWCNMGIITTNSSVLYKLTETPTDAEATQMRVLEIDLATYLPHKPVKADQRLATHLASNVYGVAAAPLIKMILRNREQIEDLIEKEFHDITNRLPEQAATMSRFLVCHAACAIMGAKIGRKLGLWNFSAANIKAFIVKHIISQLEKVTEYQTTPEDIFAAMMADLHNKMIVTYRFDTLDTRRSQVEDTLVPLPTTGSIAGRYAIGCAATKTEVGDPGRLYVSLTSIGDWCKARNLNLNEVRKSWLEAGLIELNRGADPRGEVRIRLGKGIPSKVLPPARCLEFVVAKVRGAMPEIDIRPVSNQSQHQSQAATV